MSPPWRYPNGDIPLEGDRVRLEDGQEAEVVSCSWFGDIVVRVADTRCHEVRDPRDCVFLTRETSGHTNTHQGRGS